MLKIILLLTAMLTALISGFFYAYACSVNPGLARLSDTEYLRAMQSINRAVLNPVFFASFFGALVLLPVSATWTYFAEGATTSFYLLVVGSAIYFIGVFLVTGMGNVPLNEALDRVSLERATPAEISSWRTGFEKPWNRFNLIRTIANLASLVIILISLIKK